MQGKRQEAAKPLHSDDMVERTRIPGETSTHSAIPHQVWLLLLSAPDWLLVLFRSCLNSHVISGHLLFLRKPANFL